ncbi:hypothetical protein EDB83DRAFT_2375723 [Lactarius deliciosus]|nr:hypothetical protein EDB83DRAFT_2375723 [Lactarius deliciosus]
MMTILARSDFARAPRHTLVHSGIFDFGRSGVTNSVGFCNRCLNGVLNGNLGVMIAELTDETNVTRGFSLLPMAPGYMIGFGMPPSLQAHTVEAFHEHETQRPTDLPTEVDGIDGSNYGASGNF